MNAQRKVEVGRAYQILVTVAGLALWAVSVASIAAGAALREQLTVLALVPVALAVGMFPISFHLPSGLKLTQEKINFTLSEALIFLVACQYGLAAAVILAGVEGFLGSRRSVRRLSSNLFSFAMMSLAAAAAASAMRAVLLYWFGAGGDHAFLPVTVAMLVASVVHLAINVGLLSTLLALRHGDAILPTWKKNLLWAVPMFIPTSTAASLIYFALQQGVLIVLVIGGPVLVAIYFGHRQYRDRVQERIKLIEESNRERIDAIEGAHRQTIEALAVAINAKDEVTHEHVLRVQIYAAGVARLLGCTEAEVEALRAGALLHDIGKIAVPDYILNKPGKLTAAEFDRMKLHTVAGAQILGRVEFPYPVVPVVRSHHERWDGRGYPDSLKAEEIPLTARILSVVDCFDAVREDRQYRKGMTRDEAIGFLMEGSGTQYDPRVVGIFITHLPEFEAEIAARRDAPAPSYGIEPLEQLSEAALQVAPAAGLAEDTVGASASSASGFTRAEREALDELKRILDACASADEKIASLVERLGALVPFDTCAFARVMPVTGESRVISAAGRDAALIEGRAISPGEGVTGWALANRKPFCNTDPKLDLPANLAARFADYRTLAVFPVARGSELYGALSLYSVTLGEYTEAHQRLLSEAAAILAGALSGDGGAARLAPDLPAQKPPAVEPTIESELTH